MMRRLLKSSEVAAKMGYSIDSWYNYGRADMEQQGFPAPIRGKEKWQHARWDEGAIDAWLDSKMDPALRGGGRIEAVHTKDWSSILEQRLQATA